MAASLAQRTDSDISALNRFAQECFRDLFRTVFSGVAQKGKPARHFSLAILRATYADHPGQNNPDHPLAPMQQLGEPPCKYCPCEGSSSPCDIALVWSAQCH